MSAQVQDEPDRPDAKRVQGPRQRAVIVAVQLPGVSDEEHGSSLDELASLAKTLGLDVVGRVSQRRVALSKASVTGEGKLLEIARFTGGSGVVPSGASAQKKKSAYVRGRSSPVEGPDAAREGIDSADFEWEGGADSEDTDFESTESERANSERTEFERTQSESAEVRSSDDREAVKDKATVVLVDHELSPSQIRNLERATDAEVLDRTAVILAIFHRHARSHEARLEVEIARLTYLTPRMRERGIGRERQRGGIGGRGAGESSAELERRKVRDRIADLRRELEGIANRASNRKKHRIDQNMVALVGYTNAGKSSLMRQLTGSDVYVADELFATLDTTVRALHPEHKPRILVTDTVGFIKKLPHDLVASFRATLDAAKEADLILHVIDASNPAFRTQMLVTDDVLRGIGVTDIPTLYVFNKIDRLTSDQLASIRAEFVDGVFTSAKHKDEVARLHARIVAFFEAGWVEGEIFVPYWRQSVLPEIHLKGKVVAEAYEETGVRLVVRTSPPELDRLRLILAATPGGDSRGEAAHGEDSRGEEMG